MALVLPALSACRPPAAVAESTGALIHLPENPAPVQLKQGWAYYPSQLCTGADCTGEVVVPAPLLWDDSEIPAIGYGTYVARVQVPESWRGEQAGVFLSAVSSSNRIFVNGRDVAGLGRVSADAVEYYPDVRTRYVSLGTFPAAEKAEVPEFVLAIQVANYTYPTGGLRRAPLFGPAGAVEAAREEALFGNIVALGVILAMALYHLGLFLNRPADRPALVFAAFCFSYVLRILFTNEVLVLNYLPGLTYAWQARVEYISFIVAGPLFALFLGVTYPFRGVRFVLVPLLTIAVVSSVFILVTPPLVFASILTWFQLSTALSVVGSIIIWSVALYHRRGGALASLLGGLVACGAAVNDILYFRLISPVGPLFQFGLLIFILAQSYLLARLFANAYESVSRLSANLRDTNRSLARFVPTEFLDILGKHDITEVQLGDQVERRMTVMFTDIRSFTVMSEQMSPAQNFNFLNSYLKRMTPIVNSHGGFVDKYIGDAIMALFPGPPDQAVRAAVEMQEEVRRYNRHRAAMGYESISIGVGIHTGDIMLGMIGHENRMEGTVISDTVNTASRVERLTRRYGSAIIISDAVLENLTNTEAILHRTLGRVRVKGRTQSFPVHSVLNGYPDDVKQRLIKDRARFHEAVELAHAEQFEEAGRLFEAVLDDNPEDTAARFYRDRIRKHLEMVSR